MKQFFIIILSINDDKIKEFFKTKLKESGHSLENGVETKLEKYFTVEREKPYLDKDEGKGSSLAFLFDIHGFREKVDEHGNPFDVIVGNDQGNSIRALNKANPGAFWEDNGLIPLLKNNGYNVLPRNLNERLAGHTLDGGYTIQKYSSDELGRGLVAIQIEVALSIREDDNPS